MSWLSQLFKSGGNPIKDAGEALDSLFTSDEERMQARAILEKMQNEFETALQTQFTERHKADMASDSWLSKNIRPGMWLGTGMVLVLAWVGDTALRNWGLVGVSDQVLEGAFWGFATISGLYIPAREAGKGIINWKKK